MERKESEEQLTHLAYYDQLTGLANRRLFRERLALDLARAKRQESRVTVLCLDLDRFKRINDSLGYEAGDALLKEIGKRLSESVREFETSAHLGGDEFAIILQDLEHEEDAMVVAQRLLDRIAQPMKIDDQDVVVTASVGIAFFPDNGDDVEQLLKCSDSAMHRAKEKGRHGYQIFSRQMHSEVLTRMSLERDLRHALERDEFRLHYQPAAVLGRQPAGGRRGTGSVGARKARVDRSYGFHLLARGYGTHHQRGGVDLEEGVRAGAGVAEDRIRESQGGGELVASPV